MKVCYFDTETTGINPAENGMIQIAMIVEIDGEVKDQKEWKVRPYPNDKVEDSALEVNGITLDELMGFPDPRTVLSEIQDFLSLYVDRFNKADKFTPAGYNVRFDINFLKAFFEKGGDKFFGSFFNYQAVDALAQVYWLKFAGKFDPLPDYKLGTVCDAMGVDLGEDAHDALADIKATRELIQALCGLTS